jgi:hypothetical protein
MSKYTIIPSRHTKKGIDIWLIKPVSKLDYSTYKQVESKIKILGGYYSRYTNSFVLETKPDENKLNEIFGDTASISETASKAGVSESKIAQIRLGKDAKFSSIDKRVLRDEYNKRKLLIAKVSYWDGMSDMNRSIPENEWSWSDNSVGFENEFKYSRSPYVSGNYISFGDYKAKYKDDVIQPEIVKTSNQKSYNYYVNVDSDNKVNDENGYKLDRIDSDNLDLQEGDRIVISSYGNKYCGKIKKKEISTYTITKFDYGTNQRKSEEQKSVRYTIELDNGIITSYANFKLDTDNECDEIATPAIFDDSIKSYKFPEAFFNELRKDIIGINYIKKQKAQRKKLEYIQQDQKQIERREKDLFNSKMPSYLGWELENKEYSRNITGETEQEQEFRIDKWLNEFNIEPKKPKALGEEKTQEQILLDQKKEIEQKKNEALANIEKKSLVFPDEKVKEAYIGAYMVMKKNNDLKRALEAAANRLSGFNSLFVNAEQRKLIKQKYFKILTGRDIAKSNATDTLFEETVSEWFIKNTDIENLDSDFEVKKEKDLFSEPAIEKEQSISELIEGLIVLKDMSEGSEKKELEDLIEGLRLIE